MADADTPARIPLPGGRYLEMLVYSDGSVDPLGGIWDLIDPKGDAVAEDFSLGDARAFAAAMNAPAPSVPDELRLLSGIATEGKWRGGHRCDGAIRVGLPNDRFSIGGDIPAADAAFIAAAVNYVRSLLAAAPQPPGATSTDAGSSERERRLEEALRPFVDILESEQGLDEDRDTVKIGVGLGYLRRARAALADGGQHAE